MASIAEKISKFHVGGNKKSEYEKKANSEADYGANLKRSEDKAAVKVKHRVNDEKVAIEKAKMNGQSVQHKTKKHGEDGYLHAEKTSHSSSYGKTGRSWGGSCGGGEGGLLNKLKKKKDGPKTHRNGCIGSKNGDTSSDNDEHHDHDHDHGKK